MSRVLTTILGSLAGLGAAAGCTGSTVTVTSTGSSTSHTSSAGSTGTTAGAGGSAKTTTSSTGTVGAGGASVTTSASTTTGAGTGGGKPVPCIADTAAGHHKWSCDGGITYDVEVPVACPMGGCGLILDMHGFTMNADSEDKGTGMRALGNKHGFVVIQPTAPGALPSWAQATHAPMVFAVLKEAATLFAADPKRIHAMGFSQGGGMTWRLVCMHADYFASVAPLSGIAGCEFSGANVPPAEVPMMQVHGDKDNIVNFASTAVPQRDAALKYWGYGAGTAIEKDAGHTATGYKTPGGTVFQFWEHSYQAGSLFLGGHCFPGGSDKGASPFQFGCNDANTFIVGELAMEFFIAHPKP